MLRRIATPLLALSFVVALAACGDTWEGAKKDTGDNLQSTGKTLDKAGKEVKD